MAADALRATAEVEIREERGRRRLRGVLVTEGRAASGGRRELFTPGSIAWPDTGVGIQTEHYAAPEVRAHPVRHRDGRIEIRAAATPAIEAAIAEGRRFMSVEFYAIRERTTKGGVREILEALVPSAALVDSPEYDTTAAEVRTRKRRRVWL